MKMHCIQQWKKRETFSKRTTHFCFCFTNIYASWRTI